MVYVCVVKERDKKPKNLLDTSYYSISHENREIKSRETAGRRETKLKYPGPSRNGQESLIGRRGTSPLEGQIGANPHG